MRKKTKILKLKTILLRVDTANPEGRRVTRGFLRSVSDRFNQMKEKRQKELEAKKKAEKDPRS